MKYFSRVLTATATALILGCAHLFAQQSVPADSIATVEPVAADSAAVFSAPFMQPSAEQKLYYIRHINIHGVEYLNTDILKASAGLVEGDSLYLPSD